MNCRTTRRTLRRKAGQGPVLVLPRRERDVLKRRAATAGLLECCGGLFGTRTPWVLRVELAIPVPNGSAEPERGFEIDPAALVDLYRVSRDRGLDWLGFYHSHPRGPVALSRADRRGLWIGFATLVLGGAGIGAWTTVESGEVVPLEISVS